MYPLHLPDTDPHALMAIEQWHVSALRALAAQLFSERRMDGDAMRNAAQLLTSIADQAIPLDSDKVL